MPLPTEKLSPTSSDEAVQTAISETIEICMREGGREQAQCVSIANQTARRATRRNLGDQSTRQIRAGLPDDAAPQEVR